MEEYTKIISVKDIAMIFLGALFFFICFFPYGVKRGQGLETFLINSRDAMLLGIGTAMLIYYCAYVIFRERVFRVVLVFIIMLGVVHFNFTYLIWQESYYQQLQLQDEIRVNNEIRNNNTFLVMFKGTMIAPCFYQNNGNSWAVTGEETRVFMSGVGEMALVHELNEDSWILNAYGMKDYDYTDKEIDGIMYVDYTNIVRGEMLKQKWNELFNKKAFDEWIKNIKNVRYVPISPKESGKLWEMYEDGELTNDIIYKEYCGRST